MKAVPNLIGKSKIFFWKSKVMAVGEAIDATPHSHHAIQIAVGINRCFRLKVNGVWQDCRAVIIDQDQLHQFNGKGDWQLLLLIEPESEIGIQIRREMLNDQPVKALDLEGIIESVKKWLQPNQETLLYDHAEAIFYQIIDSLPVKRNTQVGLDERIEGVLAIIRSSELTELSIGRLAQSVYLSESRLGHLFKEQVGVPIRSYILWLKMMTAIELIKEGSDFTTVAYQAGFSDSAHLSRTFRQMFGIKLSQLFKNSKYIQLFTYPD